MVLTFYKLKTYLKRNWKSVPNLSPFLAIFANYMIVFHKTEVQKIILRCLTFQKPNWIKSYAIKHKFCQKLFFFQFCKKTTWKFASHKWTFSNISGHLCANYMKIFHTTEIQTVILRCLGRLNLNWIKSYNIKLVKNIFLCI